MEQGGSGGWSRGGRGGGAGGRGGGGREGGAVGCGTPHATLGPDAHRVRQAVFTLVTRGRSLTSASKFSIEPNGGIFDVSLENDHASPDEKSPSSVESVDYALSVALWFGLEALCHGGR